MNENFSEREIVSLNETFSEFDLQKLEDRLETDPLAGGGLLDLSADGLSDIDTLGHCDEYKCPGMSCHGYDW